MSPTDPFMQALLCDLEETLLGCPGWLFFIGDFDLIVGAIVART